MSYPQPAFQTSEPITCPTSQYVTSTAGYIQQQQQQQQQRPNHVGVNALRVGVVLIVLGSLAFIFNIVGLSVDDNNSVRLFVIGHGFWIGGFYIVTGSLAVAAAKQKNRCLTIAFLVMAIIAAVVSVVMLTIGVIGAAVEQCSDYDCRSTYTCYHYVPPCNSRARTAIAMESLLAIIGFIAGVASIVGSAFGCRAACCYGHSATHPGAVVFTPYAGQPVIIYASQSHQQQYSQQQQQQQQVMMSTAPYMMTTVSTSGGVPVGLPAYSMHQWPDTAAIHHQPLMTSPHQFLRSATSASPPYYSDVRPDADTKGS